MGANDKFTEGGNTLLHWLSNAYQISSTLSMQLWLQSIPKKQKTSNAYFIPGVNGIHHFPYLHHLLACCNSNWQLLLI